MPRRRSFGGSHRWLHTRFVTGQPFEPREGGVKVVFDVPEDVVADAVRKISAAGFSVDRYYRPEREHLPGGATAGWVRLGAERPMHEFTDAEQQRIVAAFDLKYEESPFTCCRMGTDVWTAGGRGASSGDLEPRRPEPRSDGSRLDAGETSTPTGL
jgi:hypothetical protein